MQEKASGNQEVQSQRLIFLMRSHYIHKLREGQVTFYNISFSSPRIGQPFPLIQTSFMLKGSAIFWVVFSVF